MAFDWITPKTLFNATTIGTAATVLSAVIALWEFVIKRRPRHLLRRDPTLTFYGNDTIEDATRYYVVPHCSIIDPMQEDEMRHVVAKKESLFEVVDKFLAPDSPHRHLLLLADSGMGKSSFVLNYYARNQRRPKRKRHHLVVVPLNAPDANETIAQIEDQQDVVLFLDAFDEDVKAIADHRARLAELMDTCRPYKRVLITCRTQFFPTDEVLPRGTGIVRVGAVRLGEKKVYEFFRQYLSPFDDSQVDRFLHRRYSVFRWRQRKKAQELVKKIPLLSIRPMLLTYIPDLLNSDVQIQDAFQLYGVLVEKWLEREEGWVNKDALRTFSTHLAGNLYLNRQSRGVERIPYAELVQLAKEWDIPLKDWQIRGRSLLNRDADGNYKFAHRSIMEYLLVRRFIDDELDYRDLQLTDLMKEFLNIELERSMNKIRLGFKDLQGSYLLGANLEETELSKTSMIESNISDANMTNANLSEANLSRCKFRNANLTGANLQNSNLTEADLRGAILGEESVDKSQITGNYLSTYGIKRGEIGGVIYREYFAKEDKTIKANLDGANLTRADLTLSKGLSVRQLSKVNTLYRAQLDVAYYDIIKKRFPHLLEPPNPIE